MLDCYPGRCLLVVLDLGVRDARVVFDHGVDERVSQEFVVVLISRQTGRALSPLIEKSGRTIGP